MKKLGFLVAVIGATTLTACGNKNDAMTASMAAAVNKSLQHEGEACLGARQWPYDIPVSGLAADANKPDSVGHQLAVLQAAGILRSEDSAVDVPGLYGKTTRVPIKRFMPAPGAESYFREKVVTVVSVEKGMSKAKGSEICVAKFALDKVVRWDAPAKLGEAQTTTVTFTYKVAEISPLAKTPEFRSAFPTVVNLIDGAGSKELHLPVKLTNTGWEPNS